MMTIDTQFKNKYDSAMGLSEIADKRQKKKENKLRIQTIFIKCHFLPPGFPSLKYIVWTYLPLRRTQCPEMLHNLIHLF